MEGGGSIIKVRWEGIYADLSGYSVTGFSRFCSTTWSTMSMNWSWRLARDTGKEFVQYTPLHARALIANFCKLMCIQLGGYPLVHACMYNVHMHTMYTNLEYNVCTHTYSHV